MPLLIEDEEVDDELSVSRTWSVDENGTLRHNPSGMVVSTDRGVEVDGHEYRLSPKDIEVDCDAVLGAGASGVVQAGVHIPTGMRVAIKRVKVDSREKREQMLREIRGLIQAEGCPNLVQWFAGFVGKDTGLVHVVVELMDLGSLVDLLRRSDGRGIPPPHLVCIVAQVVRGLQHLHTRRTLHRDIKPANVLHNSLGQVKLTDFGISRDLSSTVGVADTFVGTSCYMSPERVEGKEYSFKSDVWSVGMVAFELATGAYPFPTGGFLELYECLCVRPEPRLDEDQFPLPLCDMVSMCLMREEAKRANIDDIASHSIIACQGVEEVEGLASWFSTQT